MIASDLGRGSLMVGVGLSSRETIFVMAKNVKSDLSHLSPSCVVYLCTHYYATHAYAICTYVPPPPPIKSGWVGGWKNGLGWRGCLGLQYTIV